jgi:hypothetical protein
VGLHQFLPFGFELLETTLLGATFAFGVGTLLIQFFEHGFGCCVDAFGRAASRCSSLHINKLRSKDIR